MWVVELWGLCALCPRAALGYDGVVTHSSTSADRERSASGAVRVCVAVN